jgi:hypothetical protein
MRIHPVAISSLVIIFIFSPTLPTRAESEDNQPSLNYKSITGSLVETWYDSVINREYPEDEHRFAAIRLYSLLFQIWLATENQGKPILIANHGIKNIVFQTRQYVNPADPMVLDKLYQDGILSEEGEEFVRLSSLSNGVGALKSKDAYHKLVKEFSEWLASQT